MRKPEELIAEMHVGAKQKLTRDALSKLPSLETGFETVGGE